MLPKGGMRGNFLGGGVKLTSVETGRDVFFVMDGGGGGDVNLQ